MKQHCLWIFTFEFKSYCGNWCLIWLLRSNIDIYFEFWTCWQVTWGAAQVSLITLTMVPPAAVRAGSLQAYWDIVSVISSTCAFQNNAEKCFTQLISFHLCFLSVISEFFRCHRLILWNKLTSDVINKWKLTHNNMYLCMRSFIYLFIYISVVIQVR